MADVFMPVPNIGFELGLSAFKVDPVVGDKIGDIRSITGLGLTVNTTDATSVSSVDGYTRTAPTTKTFKPFTVTMYKNNDGYNKLLAKVYAEGVTSEDFFCSVTIVYPKLEGVNDLVDDFRYDGFISELSLGDVEAEGVQTFSFVFTPVGKPVKFAGFVPAG